MKLLQVEKFETALDFLGRAKQLITADVKFGEADDRKKLLAITYNNMSCVYKRRGLLKTALGFAEKALKLETESAKADNPACTHLNLCAILSRLGRHQHALQHTQCALQLLRSDSYNGGVTPGLLDDGGDDPQSSILAVRSLPLPAPSSPSCLLLPPQTQSSIPSVRPPARADRERRRGACKDILLRTSLPEAICAQFQHTGPDASIRAQVCYHNMAVEHEFLRQYNQVRPCSHCCPRPLPLLYCSPYRSPYCGVNCPSPSARTFCVLR